MTTKLRKCFAARSRHWSRHFAMATLMFCIRRAPRNTNRRGYHWNRSDRHNRRITNALPRRTGTSDPCSSRQGHQTLPGARRNRFKLHTTRNRRHEAGRETRSGRSAARWAVLQQADERKDSSAISKQSPKPRRCRSCSTTYRDAAAWTSCRIPSLVSAKECRNIVLIKEASGSVERVGELRRHLPDAFTIFSGDDSLTLPFMAVGAAGVLKRCS